VLQSGGIVGVCIDVRTVIAVLGPFTGKVDMPVVANGFQQKIPVIPARFGGQLG
jgi:hypothetical protein